MDETEDKEKKKIEKYLEEQKPKVRNNAEIIKAPEDYPYMLHGSIDPGIKAFTPRLSARYAKGMEDRTVMRVHVSESIVGCIFAMDELTDIMLYNTTEEESEVFKGGWYIYAIPYNYALKPNHMLVHDSVRTSETWLVPYSKETKEYKGEIIAKLFVETMHVVNMGMDENKNTLRKYVTTYILEVMDKTVKIDQLSNKQYGKGLYKVEIVRTDDKGHHVFYNIGKDNVRVIKLDKNEYKKKKKEMAPNLFTGKKTFLNW